MAGDNNSDYAVVDVQWRTAKMTLQIIKIPEDKLAGKLATLDATAGLSKIEYLSFLVGKCVVDQERITRYINSASPEPEMDLKLQEEVCQLIIRVNPALDPRLLALSDEGNVVMLSPDEPSTRLLVDNPSWDISLEDLMADFHEFFIIDDDEPQSKFSIEQKVWEEAGVTVPIYKLEDTDDDLATFFADRSTFTELIGYKGYVIQNAIVGFHDTILRLEHVGIAHEMSSVELTDKLFGLVVDVNPFMAIDAITERRVVTIKKAPIPQAPTRRNRADSKPPAGTKGATADAPAAETKNKNARTFSSVTPAELLVLGDKLNEKVIGQGPAVAALCETLQVAGAGLRDPEKPLGTFLLTGETGVGKTFLAKVLSEVLVGSATSIVRVDCSEYGHAHEVSKLIGSPPGYIGHDAGGQLTNKVIQTPFSVVLFDEIEKAHSKLYDILLQILDEGRLTDGKGVTVDFSDCVVLMTSNIGVRDVSKISKTVGFGDVTSITQDKRSGAIGAALRRHFKPEFLNRLDGILTFNALDKDDSRRIAALTFSEVGHYLDERNVTLVPSEALVDHVLDTGFSREYGARALKRTIESTVIKPLAIKMLSEKVVENCKVHADYVDGKVTFELEKVKPLKPKKIEVSTSEIFR